jgi:hypothetical protein
VLRTVKSCFVTPMRVVYLIHVYSAHLLDTFFKGVIACSGETVIFFDTRRFPWAVDLKNVIISWLIKASLQFFLHFNYSNMSSTELQDFLTTAVEIAKQAGEVIHLHTFWLLFSFIWFNSWLSCLLDNGP